MTTETKRVLPDPSTPYGEAVRRRLREEEAIWLTTVTPSGIPQPNPVWFLWQEDAADGEGGEDSDSGEGSFLIYHDNTATRLRTLIERPSVTLHFDGSHYLEVMIFTGEVEILQDAPPAHEVPEYAAKYAAQVAEITTGGKSLEEFMSKYSVVTRIRPTRVRGF